MTLGSFINWSGIKLSIIILTVFRNSCYILNKTNDKNVNRASWPIFFFKELNCEYIPDYSYALWNTVYAGIVIIMHIFKSFLK